MKLTVPFGARSLSAGSWAPPYDCREAGSQVSRAQKHFEFRISKFAARAASTPLSDCFFSVGIIIYAKGVGISPTFRLSEAHDVSNVAIIILGERGYRENSTVLVMRDQDKFVQQIFIKGFSIKAGKEIAKDFDFACKSMFEK